MRGFSASAWSFGDDCQGGADEALAVVAGTFLSRARRRAGAAPAPQIISPLEGKSGMGDGKGQKQGGKGISSTPSERQNTSFFPHLYPVWVNLQLSNAVLYACRQCARRTGFLRRRTTWVKPSAEGKTRCTRRRRSKAPHAPTPLTSSRRSVGTRNAASSPFDNPSTILSEVEGSGQEAQEHRPAIPERP